MYLVFMFGNMFKGTDLAMDSKASALTFIPKFLASSHQNVSSQ